VKALGPGLVTGASDDDPSGIATYAQAGAQFQYLLLWLSLFTFPLMTAIQEICDRSALATGKSLGALAAERFARRRAVIGLLLALLILANTLNIAADAAAVGAGMHLLHAGPVVLWSLLTGVFITAAVAQGSFEEISRIFKMLCLMLLAYVVVMFVAHPVWSDVLVHAVVPHIQLSKDYMLLVVAVLGTTISPYLLFWQSANRIEEMRAEPEGGSRVRPLTAATRREPERKLRLSRLDVFSGMALSQVVMFAIIVATGATIGAHGSTNVTSAAQAAQALHPAAGRLAETLFAIGFIGTGVLAIPVLAGSGAAGMAALVGKPWGFSRHVRDAPLFYVLVAAGTLGGTVITLFGVDPVKLLVFSALINGLLAAPFLALVMLITHDVGIMGERYRNGHAAQLLGWTAVVVMAAAAACYLVLTYAP
jgi:NRAMP (natural resistance-associated macrophage protein)-like metal ion transporter